MTDEIFSYAVQIRRQLHMYPEVGFDLPKTVSLVCKELDGMNIPYTSEYGKGSIVGSIGQGSKTIALRADMDALPVEEKNDLPYKSRIPGKMHACGHDSHTAVLLATAKYLKSREHELPCRVRFIFQPSEEGAVSGAKMMVGNGVLEGVSHIIGAHCENLLPTGNIGVHSGDYMAACIPATIRFFGKTSHAAIPTQGIDAIAMANEAYIKMKEALKEEASDTRYIWSVGRFSGGEVHNVIADSCEMDISFRFYDMDFASRAEKRVKEICRSIAAEYGGKTEFVWYMSTGSVYNDPKTTECFKNIVSSQNISVREVPSRMSSEDFGWYLTKVPGLFFRFGTRNENLGCTTSAHCNDFMLDEEGMRYAIKAFTSYVLNYKDREENI